MKIALVFPRSKYPSGEPPLGLCYIASSLLNNTDATVDIIDTTFDNDPFTVIKEKFSKTKYDFAGFSVMTSLLSNSNTAARLIKQISPGTKIIYGGPLPTIMPEKILNIPEVDVIVLKEGEKTFVELIQKNDWKNIKGIWYKDKNQIVKNPFRSRLENLDALPFPARHLIDMEKYIQHWFQLDAISTGLRGTSIIATRGCPYICSFCQPILTEMFGTVIRKRSPKNVVSELKQLKEEYAINAFEFLDDTFTLFPEWVYELCDEMIKEKVNMIWGCLTRANLVKKEMFATMKKAGLRQVYIGMESGSQRVLDDIYQKKIKIEDVHNAVKILKELDLKIQGFFMVGAPTETVEEIKQTIHYAKNLDIDIATFSVATPLPMTHLYNRTYNLIEGSIEDMDYYKKPIYKQSNHMLSPRTINFWKKRAYLEFYLHPKRIKTTLRQLLSVKKAYYKLKRF